MAAAAAALHHFHKVLQLMGWDFLVHILSNRVGVALRLISFKQIFRFSIHRDIISPPFFYVDVG